MPNLVDKSIQQSWGLGSPGIFGGNSNRHTNEGVKTSERRLERLWLQGRAANVKTEKSHPRTQSRGGEERSDGVVGVKGVKR